MSLFISRPVRELLGLRADPILARTHSSQEQFIEARRLANLIDETHAAFGVSAGELNALSSFVEVLRGLIERHLERFPGLLEEILAELNQTVGADIVSGVLDHFADEFLLRSNTGDSSSIGVNQPRTEILKELLVFRVVAGNPAADPFSGWLTESPAFARAEVVEVGRHLEEILFRLPSVVSKHSSWGDELWAPSRTAPFSLGDQLRFLGERWAPELGDATASVLGALDLIAEEEAPKFPPGPGPVELPAFEHLEREVEAFSPDSDWMPGLVLLAKNCLIWLSQLTEKYGRSIKCLDQIPQEELEEMAQLGITGLWLVGIWERSAASKQIKRLTGNIGAEASAYALAGYRVAANLGGEAALELLRESAAAQGIRLAADMTPNHLGVDSDWVVEHPERFLSSSSCPFPAYAFSGSDLSGSDAVGIYLEDHYLDRSDAAVVFKRVDRATGEERFIYHGNDGTSTPWNDTAQLDYLRAETREAVMESILQVARQFSVIRFDAAMTLAREHIQRLWYPQPGHGGAIPSRAEHAMAGRRFDELMPKEFWREVVDRVEAEVPGTLLLAEAFWLMEGYFVRSLGMHRVYNSAFMNLLRDGENAKLRTFIRETLAFDARILERYVNFLTNPDEKTALEQFGDSDRYFGTCVLMVTLPGLPMFGHGQFEGFSEKYGMEYGKAFHDESTNEEILARHRREIVPLLKRRQLFATARNFALLDFLEQGAVNENVIAFSNRLGEKSVLVVMNNSARATTGYIPGVFGNGGLLARESSPETASKATNTAESRLRIKYYDSISGRSYLRSDEEAQAMGLSLHLDSFGYGVFEGFERIADDSR